VGAEGSGLLLLANASHAEVDFLLPTAGRGRLWRLRLDSASGEVNPGLEPQRASTGVLMPSRCVQVYSAIAADLAR
jgi:hypothetical protein